MTARPVPKSVAHKPKTIKGKWVPYAYGSTESAIKRAATLGKDGIDLDLTIDLHGVGWVNHNQALIAKDAWFDPRKVYGNTAVISKIPTADLARFTSPYGDLLTALDAMAACAEHDVIPCLESKHDPRGRDRDESWWRALKTQCDAAGFDPIVMTLPSNGRGIKRLEAAYAAGFRTMWLWRGVYPHEYDAHICYVKSRPGRDIYATGTPIPPLTQPPEEPMPRLPASLPKTLRAVGLKVTEVQGWETRGRPGAFDPVGVLCHHTATRKSSSIANVVGLLKNGRSDLPGPLCQLGLGRDGTVFVIAAGRANHGGKAKASGTVAAGDANELYIGIEAFNDGVGEKWLDVQYDAYVLLAATLCREITGSSAETVRGHKEASITGKVDPTFDMGRFRAHVAARLQAPVTPPRVEDQKLNKVEQAHRLTAQALKIQAEANALLRQVDERPHVAKMLTKWTAGWHLIADAKAEGPQK